ncbi:hypothetical protein FA15DRAFT_700585 [Coprinopsis marcescibilis]|uniref:NACHT domain-containing protein n=1 Tax=Coprinopsis marcescibilis TaxID=230819 RepID=A0A5C3LK55_COPMA|nr:hypothetical protein FA15DRAFT_700585 [Coprinopsis marcescibilis]
MPTPTLRQTFITIIDALDEGQDAVIVDILRSWAPRLPHPFRIIATTRPEPRIMKYFDSQPHIRRFILYLTGESSPSRPSYWDNLSQIQKAYSLQEKVSSPIWRICSMLLPSSRTPSTSGIRTGGRTKKLEVLYLRIVQTAMDGLALHREVQSHRGSSGDFAATPLCYRERCDVCNERG